MEKRFYFELSEMAKEALDELDRYETTGDSTQIFDKIRAIASPCLDGQKINSSIKNDLPIRDNHNFEKAIFSLYRTNTLSGGKGGNQGVKSCLAYIHSKARELSSNGNQKSNITIFYSWQASLPNKTNRNLIKDCLEKAIKEINKEISIESRVSLDSDTSNTPGSPDIINTILKKIDNSSIFVADVTLVHEHHPISNVMFELGYAMKAIGDKNIIMIFNEAFGETKNLPFDLGFKRQTMYKCTEHEEDISTIKKELILKLKSAVSIIIQKTE